LILNDLEFVNHLNKELDFYLLEKQFFDSYYELLF